MEVQFDILNLFHKAKAFYRQSKTFYISSTPLNGLHLGVYPDPRMMIFSEYVFGNTKDMKKMVKNARKDIFKSFYCTMCTIEEPDNVSSYNDCGTLEKETNMALKINQKVSYNGIQFLISGTAPQYYYNHLLLSTIDHYSTYMIFEKEELFRGVCQFSEDLARQSENSKLIFNGTFGSDIWHFHVHVTDTVISYVDTEFAVLEQLQTKTIGEENGSLGVVNYKVIASSDIGLLFNRVYQLTRIVYSPNYISRERYLSAVFKTRVTKTHTYYMIFLITGNRRPLQVGNKTYMLFYPAAALKTGTEEFSKELLSTISQSIVSQDCYTNWSNVDLTIQPKQSLRVEFFENTFRKKCGPNYLALPDIQNIFHAVDSCILQKKSCGTENADVFATYKYVISLMFICMTFSHPKDTEQIIYKRLVSDQRFLHHALKSGIAYLTNNYNITDSRSLFLKGPIATKVFEDSFNSFNLITSSETSIPSNRLVNQTDQIRNWINFNPGNRIGKNSAMGIVYSSSLHRKPEIEFVIKTINPKQQNNQQVALFYSEFAAGIKINMLREKIPNFLITLGGFECNSDPLLQTICQNEQTSKPLQFILLEKMNNAIAFGDYIRDANTDTTKITLAIYQIAVALYFSQKQLDFTHYDLHTDNIMITYLVPNGSAPLSYKYKFGDVSIFDVPAYINCTIIDYGMTHIKGLSHYPAIPGNQYGFSIDRPNFNRDIFSVVIHSFYVFLATKSQLEINHFFENENPLKYLIGNLFSSYPGIFRPNPLSIISQEYSKVFNTLNFPKKFEFLKELFNYVRSDGLYYLYLPENYPFPSKGMYKSQLAFINEIKKNRESFPVTNPDREYRWGDFDNPGCFIDNVEDETKEREIWELRQFIKSQSKTKSPKKSSPLKPEKIKKSPPKEQKVEQPSDPSLEVTAEEKSLLADISVYNKRTTVQTGGNPTKEHCDVVLKDYSRFWSEIVKTPKIIKTRKDLLKFKREILLFFHPDKYTDGKRREWATKMTQELSYITVECEKYLDVK